MAREQTRLKLFIKGTTSQEKSAGKLLFLTLGDDLNWENDMTEGESRTPQTTMAMFEKHKYTIKVKYTVLWYRDDKWSK